jgi:hypothetical protein
MNTKLFWVQSNSPCIVLCEEIVSFGFAFCEYDIYCRFII